MSSIQGNRLVWFLLMDSATGQPYQGTSADAVSLLPGSIVINFRDAVKAKYADSHLERVAPSDLLVYKNQDAFDKRNAEEGREQPLEVDMLVDDLGKSMNEALVVVVPTSTIPGKIGIDTSIPEVSLALARYRNLAEKMKKDASVIKLYGDLEMICAEDAKPYMFIEGSSGVGKTQVAFSMMELCKQTQRTCFYLVCLASNQFQNQTQAIYRAFKGVSCTFRDCLRRDIDDNVVSFVCELSEQKLYTFGFIQQLILGRNNETLREVQIGQLHFNLVKEQVDSLKPAPFVFLDEFLTSEVVGTGSFDLLRLARNCFRALGFSVAVLGTDNRATNSHSVSAGSRCDDTPVPWCHVVTELPPVHESVYDEAVKDFQEEYRSVWIELLKRGRPWFTRLVVSAIGSATQRLGESMLDLLQDVIIPSCLEIVKIAKFQNDKKAYRGQSLLHLNSSFPDSQDNPMITRHFAVLDTQETGKSFTLTGNMGVIVKEEGGWASASIGKWKAFSHFPSVGDEPLLYFILLGRCTFHDNVGEIFNEILKNNIYYFSEKNAQQRSSSGMHAEAVLGASICDASHYGRLRGTNMKDFLVHLVLCLQGARLDLKFWVSDNPMYDLLSGKTIPFCAPPNQEWPDYLKKITGIKLGSLSRTANAERVDLRTDFGVSGECKQRSSNLNTTWLKEILVRIPGESVLHIVYTSAMNNTFFNDSKRSLASTSQSSKKKQRTNEGIAFVSEEEQGDGDHVDSKRVENFRSFISKQSVEKQVALECAFFKVVDGTVSTGIPGLPNAQNPRCIVLFVIDKKLREVEQNGPK